jgi:protease IV
MLQFFKYVFATIVGLFLFCLLGIFLFAGIAAAFSSGDSKTAIDDNTILKLNLNREIKDNLPPDDSPFKNFQNAFGGSQPEAVGLVQLKKALANAKADSKIKGIYLEANSPVAGYASIEEVRNALIDFKKSGKFIYAYGEYYMEKGYYLSSIADKIYLNPAGLIDFNGLSAEYTFFKGTLDKLEIKPVIFKVGDYKSAVEPFLLEKMSAPSREQTTSFLGSINDFVFKNIADSRSLRPSDVKQIADSLTAFKPKGALQSKLVTDLGYYSDVENAMKKILKTDDDKKIKFTNVTNYLKADIPLKEKTNSNKIAVLSSEGEITSGKGSNEIIGSDKFVEELRKLRVDKKVKAIVLRINSPGGSSLASDIMWNEVELTKKVKPVIASFSDYAASGGYYMGMGADAIVAQPTTITGSIGIFMMLFNAQDFMKNKLGITTDNVSTNAHSDFPSVTRALTPFENNILQSSVNQGYEMFTSKAAQGRKMPIEKLKSIASGRVWTGLQAKENGLIDELGGIDVAIKLAAKKAKLKEGDYSVKYAQNRKSFMEEIFESGNEEAESKFLTKQFGQIAPLYKKMQTFTKMEGMQARMEYELELR